MTNRLHALTFDCADAAVLGRFWAQALGQELDPGASKAFASIGLHDAARTDIEMGTMRWTTLQDPDGNEFDVIAQPA